MKRKKVKIKYKNFAILFVVVIVLFMIIKPSKEEKKEEKIEFKTYIGKKIDDLPNLGEIAINKDYEYSDIYLENEIIDIKEEENNLKIILSKGKMDDSVYEKYNVNELGRVPIMMYHGIIDTVDNKYTGGNVDKDGYNRTANAFRKDLEMYYEKGYRMIRLADYVNGIVDVELGYSPIILTFDDGNKNNFNVLGRNADGSLKIDPECAVGILEDFKKKHPDMHVTATFFVMENLFNQREYNEEILKYLVDNGYDVGNHTTIHADFTKITEEKSLEVVGKMYQKLDSLLKDKYVKIIALPFGSPYKKTHNNYPYIIKGDYNGFHYESEAALRVGWEPEISPFNKDFDKLFLKRCRAYDNNGKDFDIEFVFKNLEKNRYISDGNKDLIVIKKGNETLLNPKVGKFHAY